MESNTELQSRKSFLSFRPEWVRWQIVCLALSVMLSSLQCQLKYGPDRPRPETMSLYPDTIPELDASGHYYRFENLTWALEDRAEPEKIRKIDEEIRRFDDWIEQTARIYGIQTVTVALVNDRNVLYQRAVHASIQKQYPVVSFTKPWVALAILQLAEKGKLNLDEPINTYLPGIIAYHPTWPQVTVRHLLTHTSGVSEGGFRNAPPGTRFAYSNNGYRMLGRLVAVVSGMPLHRYLQEFLMKPMDMQNSSADYKTDGAAGLWTSTVDMRKFLIMLLDHGIYRGHRIISEESYQEMFGTPAPRPQCPYVEYRGISWRIWNANGKNLFLNHAALWYGMGGTMQWYPEYGVGWIFMSNPQSHNHPAFRAFYLQVRARLHSLAATIGDIPYRSLTYLHPCYYQTVNW